MAFFFSGDQIVKLKSLIPEKKLPEREHSSPAYLAKEILGRINPENIKMSGGVITICQDAKTYSYDYYGKETCMKAAEELKKEIEQLFGVDAEVAFFFSESVEREPDPLPPMYWGGTETIYYYSLTVKVMMQE